MERNNVIEVMCSAAAAHGRKAGLEDARAGLPRSRSMQDEQSIQRVISRGLAEDTSLGKRANPDPVGPYGEHDVVVVGCRQFFGASGVAVSLR